MRNNPLLANVSALIAGALFGVGLVVSGMTDTHKVIGFLDVLHWDYDLAFVMVGAIGIAVVAFAWTRKMHKPVFTQTFNLPTNTVIDKRLIGGAVLFGMGWGVYGLCPAPAVVALLYGEPTVYAFFVAMIVGFWLSEKVS